MSKKNEYENLKNYFKYLITLTTIFIGIIATIGAVIFVLDRNALEAHINELREESNASIKRTENIATLEIEKLKRDIKEIAEKEITKELEYIFAKENISELIKQKVSNEITLYANDLIESEINQFVNKSNDQLTESMEINDAALKMRIGHFKGFELLQYYSKNSKLLNNRARAQNLLLKITNDYSESISGIIKELQYMDNIAMTLRTMEIPNDSSLVKNLVSFINGKNNLNQISYAIAILNIQEGTKFSPFEINEINSWYKKY